MFRRDSLQINLGNLSHLIATSKMKSLLTLAAAALALTFGACANGKCPFAPKSKSTASSCCASDGTCDAKPHTHAAKKK